MDYDLEDQLWLEDYFEWINEERQVEFDEDEAWTEDAYAIAEREWRQ